MRGGIDWGELVGNRKDIQFARGNLPALEHAANFARERAECVQAGANIGIFPLFLAQCFERVHCFEPSQDALDCLFENVPQTRDGRVIVHDTALGERSARGYLHARRRNGLPGHSGTYHVTLRDVPGAGVFGGALIKVETIDALALMRCGLIYLDIEGFELYALKGARATIARCRPVIGVEINKNLDQLGIKPSEIVELITEHGYKAVAAIGSDRIFVPREWR